MYGVLICCRIDNLSEVELMTIDCRQIVTSVACGTCHGTAPPDLSAGYRMYHWEKYDPILAIGLRNGRIRLFDTRTGRYCTKYMCQ